MGKKRVEGASARAVHIEMLVAKHVNCEAFLGFIPQGIKQKKEQTMVYAEFGDMALYIIVVQYRAERIYDLEHSLSEPPLYAAIDLGVKMLEALRTG